MQRDELLAPTYDDIVDAYELTLLKVGADWSIENGDLALTKDGDIKLGDNTYNGLFRLVQNWRFSEPHLRYLFAAMNAMLSLRERLDGTMNEIGEQRHAEMLRGHLKPNVSFGIALNNVWDQQAAAAFGAGIYAGSLMLMLSGALLRFKDDIDGKLCWANVGKLYNNQSVGTIIEAGANGFRHSDEWAKTRNPDARQKRSQSVITTALSDWPLPDEVSPGRCVELIQLLSEGVFERLASNIFAFAHALAVGKHESARK